MVELSTIAYRLQAGVQGGGGAKKRSSIRANFELFHLYFAIFLVENIIFSAIL